MQNHLLQAKRRHSPQNIIRHVFLHVVGQLLKNFAFYLLLLLNPSRVVVVVHQFFCSFCELHVGHPRVHRLHSLSHKLVSSALLRHKKVKKLEEGRTARRLEILTITSVWSIFDPMWVIWSNRVKNRMEWGGKSRKDFLILEAERWLFSF